MIINKKDAEKIKKKQKN